MINALTPAWTAIGKNSEEWLPHIGGAGIVSALAASCLSIRPRHLINGSSFITGGLTFVASQIVFQLLEKQGYSPYTAIAGGALATAVFAHLMAVPIITALFFAVLGNAAKYALDKQDITTDFSAGLNFSLKRTIKNISCGATGGFIYALFTRHLGCRTAMEAGIEAWGFTLITQVVINLLLPESPNNITTTANHENEGKNLRKRWGFAMQMTGVAVACYSSSVPAVANIFMIVIADLLHKSCPN